MVGRWSLRSGLLLASIAILLIYSFSTISRLQAAIPSIPKAEQLRRLQEWRPPTDWIPALRFQDEKTKSFSRPSRPIIPGYGSISDPSNPYRERFFVPVYACNEQETSSQRHIRQLLYMAKALDRTLVLPNWGPGLPQLSPKQRYSFADIYETESANQAGLWNVPYPVFEKYVTYETTQALSSRMSAVFWRKEGRYAGELLKHTDEEVLHHRGISPDYYDFVAPPIYVPTNIDDDMSRVVEALQGAQNVDVLFQVYHHASVLDQEGYQDPQVQLRPMWGLWGGMPFPFWNYSQPVTDIFDVARSKLPKRYAALQWRMELVPPDTLDRCAELFAEAVISGCREKKIHHVYVATDMPIGEGKAKSASFNAPEVAQAINALRHLLARIKESNLKITTWDDIRPEHNPALIQDLAEDASGVFDKLVLGMSDWMFAPNPRCGFKSSYVGSIQTVRQDRIGDPQETDWEKLGMTWIGEPIDHDFWWDIEPGSA